MTTETRYQRIAREQRERQEARAQRRFEAEQAARRRKYARKFPIRDGRKLRSEESYEDRLDDLGESPDY